MKWKDLLKDEIEYTYKVTDGLMAKADEDKMDWKPSATNNWMTQGQLLKMLTDCGGQTFRGFTTGDWGMPVEKMKPEEMMPPAEKMPTIGSVKEARKLLAQDKALALKTLDEVSEERLNTEISKAPWDKSSMVLGRRLLQMVAHLWQHKGQLFYYLKLQGKPVNTMDLWGN